MILWHLLNSNPNKSSMFTAPKAGICFHFSVLVSTGRKQLRHELVFFFISPARCVVPRIATVRAPEVLWQSFFRLGVLSPAWGYYVHQCYTPALAMLMACAVHRHCFSYSIFATAFIGNEYERNELIATECSPEWCRWIWLMCLDIADESRWKGRELCKWKEKKQAALISNTSVNIMCSSLP